MSKATKKRSAKKTLQKVQTTFSLPNPLIYRLTDPGYTIYHRAALGGLAATVRAWQTVVANKPEGIQAELSRDYVRLSWKEKLSDQEVLRQVLSASFRLTEEQLIDLPGHGIREDKQGLRLAIHNSLMHTFLQSKDSRKAEKKGLPYPVKSVDDEAEQIFTYQPVISYFHQKAHEKMKLKTEQGATITQLMQWVVPGAMKGACTLEAPFKDGILLLFLMVGCATFIVAPRRSHSGQAKKRKGSNPACIIVPDVIDLLDFANSLRSITSTGQNVKRLTGTYFGHVVGGAEEAALRFLIDLQAYDVTLEGGVAGCRSIAMTKVAWDKKQFNRSMSVQLKSHYPEMNVFNAANQYLGGRRSVKTGKDECEVLLDTYVPALVASNLVAVPTRHWCTNFKALVSTKAEFRNMFFNMTGGLTKMREAIRDEDDQSFIRVFHKAWGQTMGALGDRSESEGREFNDLVAARSERIRNQILRAKTANQLANWFLDFCARATEGAPLSVLAADQDRIRRMLFDPHNFERTQNLCLFALLSYSRDQTATKKKGEK